MLGRLDPRFGFFLESVDYPDVLRELKRIHNSVRISPIRQRNFEYARAQTVQRFGNLGFAAFRRERERIVTIDCAAMGNVSNARRAALSHDTGRVLRVLLSRLMLSYLTTLV